MTDPCYIAETNTIVKQLSSNLKFFFKLKKKDRLCVRQTVD